jgi:uncharacterized UPF0160 family protein
LELSSIAYTHNGKFHADDVFGAALLKMVKPDILIKRVSAVPEGFAGMAFDIGHGRFDHHQADAEIRENGVPYAAFGLLWREFGEELLRKGCNPEDAAKAAAHFDEKFVQPLDEDDNTGCGNQLAGAISSFNPVWDSDEDPDVCFAQAVEFASAILHRKLEGMFGEARAKAFVTEALEKSEDGIVVLPHFAPWKTVLVPSSAKFVVYPSQRGGYNAQAIPETLDGEGVKCPFPIEWAGKESEELQALSGLKTLRFCHRGRFLAAADTLEDAKEACRIAMRTT